MFLMALPEDEDPEVGANMEVQEKDQLSRIPTVNMWFNHSEGMVLLLTNGTVQIDFCDQARFILNPLLGAVTYIDETGRNRTFR